MNTIQLKANETTFVCENCKHELPIYYQHEEKPGVCFLDYVSEADAAYISQLADEAHQLFSTR